MVVLRLIGASIRRQPALYGVWIASLAASVVGLVVIDVYRQSLTFMVSQQGRKILTADISLSAQRHLTETERTDFLGALHKPYILSNVTEMTAMVSSRDASRLAQLRFVDDGYPLLGDLYISGQTEPASGSQLGPAPEAWVGEDLLPSLGLEVGQLIKIGDVEFRIAAIVTRDSAQTMRFGNLAPKVYLHRKWLAPSHLVQFGSTFSETLYAVAPGVDDGLRARLEKLLTDPGVTIRVPKDLERGVLGVLARVLDYLGLVGLLTLCMGWIGVYYLGRRWLSLERRGTALLKCLGMSSGEISAFLFLKLMVILVMGTTLGSTLSWLVAKGLLPLFRESLPPEFTLTWSWANVALAIAVGPLAGGILLAAPLLACARETPSSLQESQPVRLHVNWVATLAVVVSAVALFTLLTVLQARSFRVAGVFLGSVAACVGGVAIFGLGLLNLVRRRPFGARGGFRRHLAGAQWSRRPGTTLLLVTVCALAATLGQLVPHLERTLVGELRAPEKNLRPALFLIDIQPEQVQPLTEFLVGRGVEVSQSAPFIRSRLLAVNGRDFERRKVEDWSTREQESEARLRNRGVNLSYREALSPSEKILQGKDWENLGPGEVGIERDYADRLGFQLGDSLVFDVQGMEIQARIASVREINWDSFEPNFFIQFRLPGDLAEAPKTWIMTIKQSSGVRPAEMQRQITARFPNVSSLNVEETVDNIAGLVSKMSWGLTLASRLAMALGIMVFLTVLLFQLSSSAADWAELRLLGLTYREIWGLQMLTFAGLAVVGSVLGTGLAGVATWALAKFAFETLARWDLPTMFGILGATWLAAAVGLTAMSLTQFRTLTAQRGVES